MEAQDLIAQFKIFCDQEALSERISRYNSQLQKHVLEVGDINNCIRAYGSGQIVMYKRKNGSTKDAGTNDFVQKSITETQYEQLKKYYLDI